MTRRMVRLLSALTAVLILGNGGALMVVASADDIEENVASNTTDQTLPSVTTSAGQAPSSTSTTVGSSKGTRRTTTTAAPAPSQKNEATRPTLPIIDARRGDLPLEVTVAPGCVRRGQKATATIQTVKGAHVSLVVAYSDASNYGEMTAGPVATDGSSSYSWVVPVEAPEGAGQVFVAGGDGERSGSASAVFHVKGAKGC